MPAPGAQAGPRVVVLSLASDYGCQVQMTNMEDDLLDVLGLFQLSYWQLASSGDMPEDYDVAIVEGAVTVPEHVELLKSVREAASSVIAIGACAVTGGVPALAGTSDLAAHRRAVYANVIPDYAAKLLSPGPVSSVIDVDYLVPGCPIEQAEFLDVLSRALMGLSDRTPIEPMCASCKTKENLCFFERGTLCLGVVTRNGCGARCVTLGRPCTGCRGVAEDANFPAVERLLVAAGEDPTVIQHALAVFNSARETA